VFAITPVAGAGKAPTKSLKKRTANPVKRVRPVKPNFDVAIVNNPLVAEPVAPKSEGSAVLRAQILLDRAHFSPGEMDGRYGDTMRIAIEGYQAARKMPVTGIVDTATWQSLNADLNPALIAYTVTEQDAAGPFERTPAAMMEKARLKALGYQSPAEELGEKFHIQPRVLALLNGGKDLGKAGQQLLVPNVQRPSGAVKAERVVVSKSKKSVSALAGDGTILAQYPATMGSEHDPLPIGEWKVTSVLQNPVFHYNPELFWDANPKDSKADIPPGPNNPVGVVWIGLSKEHYGIHGTPEPGAVSHTQSHGCIRLTNWDAEELSHMVKAGTPALLEE
jgi:lipoprotein-anchoring transpeptidase ErfK/SrfK